MSFQLTTAQILDRSKTVTRRLGWTFLKPGDLIQAIEKGQGLKKGETVNRLAVLRVEHVSRERLDRMEAEAIYGQNECRAEGFPNLSPMEFVAMFCASHRLVEREADPVRWLGAVTRPCRSTDEVTRIQFSYIERATP